MGRILELIATNVQDGGGGAVTLCWNGWWHIWTTAAGWVPISWGC